MDNSADCTIWKEKWEECAATECGKCAIEYEGKLFASVVICKESVEHSRTEAKDVYLVEVDDLRDEENPLETICTQNVSLSVSTSSLFVEKHIYELSQFSKQD